MNSFVKEKRLGDGRIQYTFMCSLRIIDGSSFMDVILYQEEAERFFGISTAQLFENQNQIQTQIEQRLQQARDESMVVDMYIKSYVIDAAQTNHSNKRKRSADSNSEKLKRLAVFNTKAPFAITA